MLVQPDPGCVAEQYSPRFRVDEGAGTLVVLDLEREVLGLAQVVAEGLLTLTARTAAGRAVADHPLVRAAVPVTAVATLEDLATVISPASGAIPPRAVRGTAGTGRPDIP